MKQFNNTNSLWSHKLRSLKVKTHLLSHARLPLIPNIFLVLKTMKQDASVDLNYLLERVESSAPKQLKTELILVSNKPSQPLDTCFSLQ